MYWVRIGELAFSNSAEARNKALLAEHGIRAILSVSGSLKPKQVRILELLSTDSGN